VTAYPRRATRGIEHGFESLSIEGGLLAPAWLARVAQLSADAQREADYRVPKGLQLRDEIGRYWRIAQAHWFEFTAGRSGKGDARALSERFVLGLLRDAFGFGTLVPIEPAALGAGGWPPPATPPAPSARPFPVAHAALSGRVPVVIAPAGSGLDALSPAFGDGVRRRSAFGLAQEFLNERDGTLWGVVSDGLTLRLVRDNASLTRPAWIEADLARLFTEERYADFAALWLLAHESRFGRADQPVADCALEVWRNAGREQGTRAREQLRRGVEEAVAALGQGFVAHPQNAALRAALERGDLSSEGLFQQLLRLVYRLIFLITVEERELLHAPAVAGPVRRLYADGYGLRRLRERAVRRSAHDRHADLWEGVKVVLCGLAGGEPRLGLPALAGIFAPEETPALDGAKLENRALLLALFKLCWLKESAGLARVNWRDMGPEELGSVYESLLELLPVVSLATRTFGFAAQDDARGNARKNTGSYYTPDSLVQALLDTALEPLVRETVAANPGKPAAALLELAIIDPACGSGHFLLAAARRLAAHVARLEADGTPSAAEYRRALRKVVGSCIYGVDLNPMAVELCKVALWMEAVEPGLPLTFLDAHVRHGNALLGATPDLLVRGIPDEAWEPLEGDDKQVARTLKKRNNLEASGQTTLSALWGAAAAEDDAISRGMHAVEAAGDEDREALATKQRRWAGFLESSEYQRARRLADAWCAAFVWPKQAGEEAEAAPTMAVWRGLRDAKRPVPATTATIVERLREQYQFFHWHLAFPRVFARGGFDVVLGNPPYLNQLETDTAVGRGVRRLLSVKFGEVKQPYTDLATLFMVAGQSLLRPGGREALVHPLALFAAQDAGPARRRLAQNGSIESIWLTTEHIFPSASVFVCAVCIRKGGPRSGAAVRKHSNAFISAEPIPVDMDHLADEPTWGELIADLIGVPRVRLPGTQRVRDLAGVTADFRDQFYGLIPYVVEDGPGTADAEYPPLVITGLIDPAVCLWGSRSCKFGKKKWERPRVDLRRLVAESPLAAWASGRLTPKIVVATQSKVIEAFADPTGRVINTVPTLTVTPKRSEDLWRLLAVLLAPPVSAWALGRYAGTALSISAIKLSAEQAGLVPLPTATGPWERAAASVQRASETADDAAREAHLFKAGALMCDAYEVAREPVLSWWRERYAGTPADTEEGT
jgi:hypothetical protein